MAESIRWVAQRQILVVTAVEAEREAVERGLGGDGRFVVIAGGVGPSAAAASTARELARGAYGLVVSAGIGGGFAGRSAVGTVVVADAVVAADLGAQTAEGFRSVDELGFGSTRIETHRELSAAWAEAIREGGLPAVTGTVLTVSTVTGTAQTADELAARIPGAVAEAMEGFGVATAARLYELPVVEIRAISNAVGPRDRDAWRIGEALAALQTASLKLKEVLA